MNNSPNWAKNTLYLAGIYNIFWGIIVVLFPNQLFALAGMEISNYPELFQCIGMMIAVFGVAYIAAYHDPVKYWPIVLAGLIGRILGPIGFIIGVIEKKFTWMAGLTIITNDLIWILPFFLILKLSYQQNCQVTFNDSLYKRIVGGDYLKLPRKVQELHDYKNEVTYSGKCYVERGNNFLINMIANLLSIPKSGRNVDVKVNLVDKGNKEIWNRSFNDKAFKSTQWQEEKFLVERVKFAKLIFKINISKDMLELNLYKAYIFGIPQIGFLKPKIIAQETQIDNKIHFFAEVSLAFFGLLVRYEGDVSKNN